MASGVQQPHAKITPFRPRSLILASLQVARPLLRFVLWLEVSGVAHPGVRSCLGADGVSDTKMFLISGRSRAESGSRLAAQSLDEDTSRCSDTSGTRSRAARETARRTLRRPKSCGCQHRGTSPFPALSRPSRCHPRTPRPRPRSHS